MARNRVTGAFAVLAVLMAQSAWAQSPPSSPPNGHKPPPHAYEDCRGKKAGEVVQHMTPNGKVGAVCEESPEGMVARPNPPPHPANGEPPPHAYEECRGKAMGDATEHATPEGKVAATCAQGPKGLMARPNQPPRLR